jgi:hypothetical protein
MEILELIAEFRVMGVNPLPILLLYYFMNALRLNVLDKTLRKIKDIRFRWLICTVIAFVLSALVTLPFSLSDFQIYTFIQNVFVTWGVGWIVKDTLNRMKKNEKS